LIHSHAWVPDEARTTIFWLYFPKNIRCAYAEHSHTKLFSQETYCEVGRIKHALDKNYTFGTTQQHIFGWRQKLILKILMLGHLSSTIGIILLSMKNGN